MIAKKQVEDVMLRTLLLMTVAPLSMFASAAASAPVPLSGGDPAIVVQAQVDAFNKGDVEAFGGLYAEDVEVFDLGPAREPNLSGRTALIARYKPMLSKYHPQATILSRVQTGSFVIDKERTEAGGRASEGLAIYQVEFGKIRRVWFTP